MQRVICIFDAPADFDNDISREVPAYLQSKVKEFITSLSEFRMDPSLWRYFETNPEAKNAINFLHVFVVTRLAFTGILTKDEKEAMCLLGERGKAHPHMAGIANLLIVALNRLALVPQLGEVLKDYMAPDGLYKLACINYGETPQFADLYQWCRKHRPELKPIVANPFTRNVVDWRESLIHNWKLHRTYFQWRVSQNLPPLESDVKSADDMLVALTMDERVPVGHPQRIGHLALIPTPF